MSTIDPYHADAAADDEFDATDDVDEHAGIGLMLSPRAVTFGLRAAALAGVITTVGAALVGISGLSDASAVFTTCCPANPGQPELG